MEKGYWADAGIASGSSQSSNGISMWAKRIMQRRKYTRLSGRSKRMHVAKLGGRKGKGVSFVWRLKAVPRLRLRVIRSAAKSWLARIRDNYMDLMTGFSRSCTISSQPASRKNMAVQDFNTKVVVEIYKSLGIQVNPESLSNLSHIY